MDEPAVRETPRRVRPSASGIILFILAGSGVLFSSCSDHAPELASLEYRLALRPLDPQGAAVSEHLSLFAAVRDEDGIKDLAALHILHDGQELYWTLTPERWTRNDRGKETWLGGTGLSAPDSRALPRGVYRVVLEDLAGESDEVSFSIGTGIEKGASFPIIQKAGDSVSVISKYPRTELLFLDASGALLRAVDAPRQFEELDRLYASSAWRREAETLAAYGYDAERNLGVFSWKIDLKP